MAREHQELKLFEMSKQSTQPSKFGRALLKLSGEALTGEQGFGVDPTVVRRFAQEIVNARQELEVELAVVVGGGNFWRGVQHPEMDPAQADYAGMLATIMNAMTLQDHLEKLHQATRVMSAIRTEQVAEPYIRRKAMRHLEKGRIVILAGGTGNPTFTTDTAAALRAMEIKAEVIMKGTKVDGIYTADPMLDPTATKYDTITHLQVLERRLRVMDTTAISLCMDNKLPIVVFNLRQPGNLKRAVMGEPIGTTVS